MSSALSVMAQPRHMKKAEESSATIPSVGAQGTIRRPVRGIQLKDDTFATIRVLMSDGTPTAMVDAGGSDYSLLTNNQQKSFVYSNFLLQSVQEDRQEKNQILETFGEPYIFLFGQRARVMNFSGVLVNTEDFNWEAEWWENYDQYMRGTRCVENDAQVFVSFDDTIVGGYMLASNAMKTANERNFVNFQFQLFVTFQTNIKPVGNPWPNAMWDERRPRTESEVAEVLAQARPAIIPNMMDQRYLLAPDGSLMSTPLGVALAASSPSSFVRGWRSVTGFVKKTLTTINGVWSGAPVRVPSGFEGSFAYDEEDLVALPQENLYGKPMRFSTYSDNVDEYVGPTDQYASSSLAQQKLPELGFQSVYQVLDRQQSIEQKAQKELLKAGILGQTAIIDKIAAGVRLARLGLSLALGVEAVVNYKGKNTVPDFTKSAMFGGTMPHMNDNPYPE